MGSCLRRIGAFSARRPWVVITVWLVAAAGVIGAAQTAGGEMRESTAVPGLDSQRAVELLDRAGADRAGLTAQVVVGTRDGSSFTTSPAKRAALADLQRRLAGLRDVVAVADTARVAAAGPPGSGVVSDDGRVALVTVQYPVMERISARNLDDLEGAVKEARDALPLQIEYGGELPQAFADAGTGVGELIGLGAAVVILLVAFGSVWAMGLPIAIALAGLAVGVSAMPLLARLMDVPATAPQMASMIGIGVGIDYALFVVTRHRELRGEGLSVVESAARATASAGKAVVVAGGTVMVSIVGLSVAGVPFLTAAAAGTSMVVLILVAAAVTLLPALLGLAGPRLDARRGRVARETRAATRFWGRWGRHVTRHAAPYAVGATGLLLLLTAPVLGLRLGWPDQGSLPESRTERRAYDMVADGFGPGRSAAIVVAVDLNGDRGVLAPLAKAIASDPGVARVESPAVAAGGTVATIAVWPRTAPQDDATYATVKRLRASAFPAVLRGRAATAHIGGATAHYGDVAGKVADRLPWFVATVLGLSFLVLMVVFRSLLVPLKAVVMNLLSVGAGYGVLVAVFQWGWGAGLIGLEETVPVISFVPMFMFAMLFGLSMDYEVFLLSRIREEHRRTRDNDAAIVAGLAATARVITSAALIMIAVFAGFVTGADPGIKMLGLGLATAILVDATVVRMVLVPATMRLLGEANWWLPAWLERLLPGDGTGGTDGEGAAARLPVQP